MGRSESEQRGTLTTRLPGHEVSYRPCQVLPDTALALRDVMKEAERLWRRTLGDAAYAELRATPQGDDFFAARVRLETVPPNREVLVVRLPFPPDYARMIKPQIVDFVEDTPA